jgi:P27 family predicted phage terminase small subunit
LKLVGGIRPARHADRLNEPQASGVPEKPRGMDKQASALWDKVVPQLVSSGIVKNLDTAELTAMCQLWSLFCKAEKAAQQYPTDKEVRSAVVAYFTAFDKAASRLGMNPAERARLSVPPEPKNDGIEAFARKRG